jgi:transcriptional regulator with XRE-family HTH domain
VVQTKTRREEWGANIRALRKSHSLSQAQLASQLGVSPQSVYNWERGLNAPRDEQKLAIAKALNSDVAYLFPLRAAP